MSALHETFLAAIQEERTRIVTRRSLLSGGAKLAGGGAIAVALAAAPFSRSLQSAVAQDFTDDLDILNYALTLEHLEYAFYRDGLKTFEEDDFKKLFGKTPDSEDDDKATKEATKESGKIEDRLINGESAAAIQSRLEEIRDHEEAHVKALTQTITDLSGTPVEEAEYDFGYDGLAEFLDVAQALENTGVAAYAGAGPSISDKTIVAAALSIHSVEARHASYLNLRTGASPFPDAVDKPLTREEVLAIAGKFIVSVPATATQTAAAGAPTAESTSEPAAQATDEPAAEPTDEPAAEPTDEPTAEPTDEPTAEPTDEPTIEVTATI